MSKLKNLLSRKKRITSSDAVVSSDAPSSAAPAIVHPDGELTNDTAARVRKNAHLLKSDIFGVEVLEIEIEELIAKANDGWAKYFQHKARSDGEQAQISRREGATHIPDALTRAAPARPVIEAREVGEKKDDQSGPVAIATDGKGSDDHALPSSTAGHEILSSVGVGPEKSKVMYNAPGVQTNLGSQNYIQLNDGQTYQQESAIAPATVQPDLEQASKSEDVSTPWVRGDQEAPPLEEVVAASVNSLTTLPVHSELSIAEVQPTSREAVEVLDSMMLLQQQRSTNDADLRSEETTQEDAVPSSQAVYDEHHAPSRRGEEGGVNAGVWGMGGGVDGARQATVEVSKTDELGGSDRAEGTRVTESSLPTQKKSLPVEVEVSSDNLEVPVPPRSIQEPDTLAGSPSPVIVPPPAIDPPKLVKRRNRRARLIQLPPEIILRIVDYLDYVSAARLIISHRKLKAAITLEKFKPSTSQKMVILETFPQRRWFAGDRSEPLLCRRCNIWHSQEWIAMYPYPRPESKFNNYSDFKVQKPRVCIRFKLASGEWKLGGRLDSSHILCSRCITPKHEASSSCSWNCGRCRTCTNRRGWSGFCVKCWRLSDGEFQQKDTPIEPELRMPEQGYYSTRIREGWVKDTRSTRPDRKVCQRCLGLLDSKVASADHCRCMSQRHNITEDRWL